MEIYRSMGTVTLGGKLKALVYDILPRSVTRSIAFRRLPPNSARFGCATEGVPFASAQLSTDAVSALRKVRSVLLKTVEATEIIYQLLHCRHRNDFCIKMGNDESHFNCCFINCEGQSHKTVLLKRKESRSRFEPRSLCLPA